MTGSRPESERLVLVAEADGQLEAEILRGLLEANGIEVWLSGESAAAAIGLGVGPLARVQILVLAEQADEAARMLADRHPPDDHPDP
jgi:hypothetical protein